LLLDVRRRLLSSCTAAFCEGSIVMAFGSGRRAPNADALRRCRSGDAASGQIQPTKRARKGMSGNQYRYQSDCNLDPDRIKWTVLECPRLAAGQCHIAESGEPPVKMRKSSSPPEWAFWPRPVPPWLTALQARDGMIARAGWSALAAEKEPCQRCGGQPVVACLPGARFARTCATCARLGGCPEELIAESLSVRGR
jgi:hypothetical protein